MNRFLQRVFMALAGSFGIFGVLVAISFHLTGISLLTRSFLGCVAMAFFFLAAAFLFNKEWKFRVFLSVVVVFLVEAGMETAGWLGVLPGVNTNIRVPYGRVYWTMEGHGNGMRNGFGWNAPGFDVNAPKRIAVIGDSQVDAIGVPRDRNHPALLQQILRRDSDWAVMGLGVHGIAPAYYIEVLKYAQKQFKPQEAIVCLSMGSDIVESSRTLRAENDGYLYYDLDTDGRLTLTADEADNRDRWAQSLELSQKPFYWWLPTLLKSHCMLVQSCISVRDRFSLRRRAAARAAAVHSGPNDVAGRDFAELGFNSTPFATNQIPEVRRAMQIMERELEECKRICDSSGIKFRVVTIPVFPSAFYETQKGRDWTTKIGDYDYFGPDRELVVWAKDKNIPLLALGDCMQSKKLDVNEIRDFYFAHGSGHLTQAGHGFCADAIYEAFYKTKLQ